MTSDVAIPKWLNDQFIEQALREYENENEIKLRNIRVKPATSSGDNYNGSLFRVTAEYDKHSDSEVEISKCTLLVKSLPQTELMQRYVDENDAFSTEIQVLRRTIPEFHRLLNNSPSERAVIFAAKCFYSTGKPHQKLVLEDLCQSGFRMLPRNVPLDLDHSKIAISYLGKFHAASVALHHKDPHSFDSFLAYPHFKNGDAFGNALRTTINSIAQKLNAWPDVAKKYSVKLNRLANEAYKRLGNAVQREEKGFNVLNHGDAWKNNMMFSYGENHKLYEVRFVDFQFVYYGSPAIDLQYFLYSSVSSEVRSLHLNHLLECYYLSLSNTLCTLGYSDQCPSLDDIHVEMDKAAFVGVFAAMCLLPIAFTNPDNITDFGEVMYENSKADSVNHFTEEFFKEIIKLLPVFEDKRLLD